MKTCTNCGSLMQDDIHFCTNCGSPLPDGTNAGQNYQPQFTPPGNSSDVNTKAVIALVLGVGGLLLTLAAPVLPGISSVVGVILSIVGIVFGVKARNEIPVGAPGRGMATGGFVCAIIGTIIGAIATCITCVCTCAVCTAAGIGASEYSGDFDDIFELIQMFIM